MSSMGTLDVFVKGSKLLSNSLFDGSGSGFGGLGLGNSFSKKSAKHDDKESDDISEDSGEEEEEGDYDDDEEEEEDEEEEDSDEEEDNFFEPVAANLVDSLGLTGHGVMSSRKKYVCNIFNVKVTNIGQRRRDVQVIMTLGALPSDNIVEDDDEDDEARQQSTNSSKPRRKLLRRNLKKEAQVRLRLRVKLKV